MNLTKFLLIDLSLMLVGFPLLLIFRSGKAKASLVENLNSPESANQFPINFPSNEELVKLEKVARKDGSGIDFESLIGLWKFFSVWKHILFKVNHMSH